MFGDPSRGSEKESSGWVSRRIMVDLSKPAASLSLSLNSLPDQTFRRHLAFSLPLNCLAVSAIAESVVLLRAPMIKVLSK